ncbi:MAG: SpaH/EbpB family LPXTG-anchored major pilin [Actinomycetaceae bacterium]|nr:SpaH/EbpB family LPXTG-anchored major pilin [Actinomycetaceae bacterium]
MQNPTVRRRVAGLFSLLLAAIMTLAVFGMSPALAADTTEVASGNINASQKGSLTIHKYAEPKTGNDNDGREITGGLPKNTALDGVTFDVQKVEGIDIATDAGWKLIKELVGKTSIDGVPADGTTQLTLGSAKSVTTANGGKAMLTGLDLGVYLVTETGDEGGNNITSKAAPFFVTIPFPDAKEASGWNYDVHVYPKNSVTSAEKVVEDTDAVKVGDQLKWHVSFMIPEGDDLKSFEITDKLDPKTEYVSATAQIVPAGTTIPVPDNVTGTSVKPTLTWGEYSGTTKQDLSAKFEEDALTTLNANKGEKVVLTIVVEVKKIEGDGEITNPDAQGWFNDPNHSSTSVTPEKPETSSWGKFQIFKYASNDKGATKLALDGAVFDIYAEAALQEDGTFSGDPLYTVTTANGGLAQVDGLKFGTYYVVETQAPAGYEINKTKTKVEVIGVNKIKINDKEGTLVEIENKKATPGTDLPELPLTGASGTLLLTLGGAALIALAVGTFFVGARNKSRD